MKTHVHIRLRRQGATLKVPQEWDLPYLHVKPFHPQFTVRYLDKHLYHLASNGPSRTRCK